MKIEYQFWRVIEVRQICHLEIDVPDDLAGDRQLLAATASATLNVYRETMVWKNDGPINTINSGYQRCVDLPPEAD